MTSTDGRREIEAIEQRLEAAKSRVVTDSNNVVSAKQMSAKMIASAQSMSDAANRELVEAKAKAKDMQSALDNVKSMTRSNIDTMVSHLDASKKEVQEVEKLLAEAEERAKQGEEGSSNKRRKISIAAIGIKLEDGNDYDKETDVEEDSEDNDSAGTNIKREEDSDHAYDDETDKEDEDSVSTQANDQKPSTDSPQDTRKRYGSIPPPRVNIHPGHGGQIWWTNVNNKDVLSGRGGRVNNHPGNVAFRRIVEDYKHEYLDPRTRKSEKPHVAARLVAQIRSSSGRFLKEDGDNPGCFIEIGDQKAWKSKFIFCYWLCLVGLVLCMTHILCISYLFCNGFNISYTHIYSHSHIKQTNKQTNNRGWTSFERRCT